VGCLLRLGFAFPLEEGGQSCDSSGFPGADLVGMDVVLGSDLSDCLLFLEGFEDDFSFDSGRMTFSHGVLSLTYFDPFHCLNFLGHYSLVQYAFGTDVSKTGETSNPFCMIAGDRLYVADAIGHLQADGGVLRRTELLAHIALIVSSGDGSHDGRVVEFLAVVDFVASLGVPGC
jgi:hypothetical protein